MASGRVSTTYAARVSVTDMALPMLWRGRRDHTETSCGRSRSRVAPLPARIPAAAGSGGCPRAAERERSAVLVVVKHRAVGAEAMCVLKNSIYAAVRARI